MVRTILVAACVFVSLPMQAQTRIDLTTQATRILDFGDGDFTRPVRTGTILPAVCETGELFFKTDALPGSNIYSCVNTNLWAAPAASGSSVGSGLPPMTGNDGRSLWTDGLSPVWKSFTTGASGALELVQTGSEVSLDIVSAIVPQKHATNVFTGLNSFGLGLQLLPQTAPANPTDGRIWYDASLQKFRCHQNGTTSDCVGGGSSLQAARTILGGGGITVQNADGVAGDTVISASPDLLNLTESRPARSLLIGPLSGGPAAPTFRLLAETDLPATIPLTTQPNNFLSLNSFSQGLRLAPQSAPATPANGEIWYDSAANKFQVRENGQTVNLRTPSGLADSGANGLLKRTAENTTQAATAGIDFYAPGTVIRSSDLPVISSNYSFWTNLPYGISMLNASIGANSFRVMLVRFDSKQTFSKASFYLNTGVDGSSFRIALYDANCSTLLFQTSAIPTATSNTGVVSTVFDPITVDSGFYMLGYFATNGISVLGSSSSTNAQNTDNSATGLVVHGSASGPVTVANGFPASCGNLTASGGSTARIVLSR